MNKVVRAFKLYSKAATHPFTIGFGLFMMIGMAIAFIIGPSPVGSEDYLEMLAVVQMSNIGTIFIIMIGNIKIQKNKFYSSCSCAKEIYVFGPIGLVTVIKVLYDTVLTISAYINLGTTGLSDILIFNAISTVLLIIIGGSFGKRGVIFISVIAYVGYMLFLLLFPIIDQIPVAHRLIGLPLWTAIIVALISYILSVAIAIILGNIHWKKGDRSMQLNIHAYIENIESNS